MDATGKQTEALALEAERRAEKAGTQEDREKWLRIADHWWNETPSDTLTSR